MLLHKQGQPSAALLPQWVSGYDHLFKGVQDLALARQLRNPLGSLVPLSLAFDAGDDLARLIAERVALNAQAAGITLQRLAPNQLRLTWSVGVLQQADNVSGPYTDVTVTNGLTVSRVTSPYTVTPSETKKFYRALD